MVDITEALLSSADNERTKEGHTYAEVAERIRDQVPRDYLCPITQDVMIDPVMAADGKTYERVAIAEWLRTHRRSPMTNAPLNSTELHPQPGLKQQIADFIEQRDMTPKEELQELQADEATS